MIPPLPVFWERPGMVKRPDSIQSSDFTWEEPSKFSDKGPIDMHLLMQHYYGRVWRIEKHAFDLEAAAVAKLESAYIMRKYISKARTHRQKMALTVKIEKPRYIHPKFRNIPSRTDSNLKAASRKPTNQKN